MDLLKVYWLNLIDGIFLIILVISQQYNQMPFFQLLGFPKEGHKVDRQENDKNLR